MSKIKALLERIFRPGPSRRNNLNRAALPKKMTGWERSQADLMALFAAGHTNKPEFSWGDSLSQIAAI